MQETDKTYKDLIARQQLEINANHGILSSEMSSKFDKELLFLNHSSSVHRFEYDINDTRLNRIIIEQTKEKHQADILNVIDKENAYYKKLQERFDVLQQENSNKKKDRDFER